jgi:hypothetical protein
VPDDRTFVTELATALGMLGDDSITEATGSRPDVLRLSETQWLRLETVLEESRWSAEAETAFDNGRAFLESPDALRERRPVLIEWTGGRRPPGDEVAPIDLRIDHVFLVSCKYVSANIANPSPARLFDGLLATTGDWVRSDWYLETAPVELRELYSACKKASGLFDLPEDPAELEPAQRQSLRKALPARSFPEDLKPAYLELCRVVSEVSASRWREAIERFGKPEQVLWRLLRIGSAPYYMLGADAHDWIRLRVASPWDWRQSFRLLHLEVTAARAGQPQVDWTATYETKKDSARSQIRGHVEVRWSHGRFAHPPEAKIYLDTPTSDLPGYFPLTPPVPATSEVTGAGSQERLFEELPGERDQVP